MTRAALVVSALVLVVGCDGRSSSEMDAATPRDAQVDAARDAVSSDDAEHPLDAGPSVRVTRTSVEGCTVDTFDELRPDSAPSIALTGSGDARIAVIADVAAARRLVLVLSQSGDDYRAESIGASEFARPPSIAVAGDRVAVAYGLVGGEYRLASQRGSAPWEDRLLSVEAHRTPHLAVIALSASGELRALISYGYTDPPRIVELVDEAGRVILSREWLGVGGASSLGLRVDADATHAVWWSQEGLVYGVAGGTPQTVVSDYHGYPALGRDSAGPFILAGYRSSMLLGGFDTLRSFRPDGDSPVTLATGLALRGLSASSREAVTAIAASSETSFRLGMLEPTTIRWMANLRGQDPRVTLGVTHVHAVYRNAAGLLAHATCPR